MKLQIALEFTIIFTLVIVVFLVLLALIINERALGLNNQAYSQLQIEAQSIAGQINNALEGGNGYSASFPVSSTIGELKYSVNITKNGIVILKMIVGKQVIQAYAYSAAKDVVSNPALFINNAYLITPYNGTVHIQNSQGAICIDYQCPTTSAQAAYISLSEYKQRFSSNTLFVAKVTNASGAPLLNELVGFVTSAGNFVNSTSVFITHTNSNGVALALLNNTKNGTNTVHATVFNGNPTTESNLVAYFPTNFRMGNMLYDISGSNNNGNMQYVSWSDPNYVASFNGHDSMINLGDANTLETNSLTWSLWIYPSYSGLNKTSIFGEASSSAGSPYIIEQGNYSAPVLEFSNDGGGSSSVFANIKTNAWQYIVGTYNYSSGIIALYVNGVLIQNATSMQIPRLPGNLYVGFLQPSDLHFKGSIANIQIYNVALSANQIRSLYQESISGPPIMGSNVVGWWPLDGNANDYSGNGNNGVIYGNLTFSSLNISQVDINASSSLVASSTGRAGAYALISNPTLNYTEAFWFKVPSNVSSLQNSWLPLTDIYNASTKSGPVANSNYDFSETGVQLNSGYGTFCLSKENWPNPVELSVCSTANEIIPGNWYFATVTGNWISENVYIDGALVGSGRMSSAVESIALKTLTNPAISFFADPPSGLEGAAAGTMLSNIQLYNSSLSASQIQQLYQEGLSGFPVNTSRLIAWYALDGNVNNYGGKSNNGVALNISYVAVSTPKPSPIYSIGGSGVSFNNQSSYISIPKGIPTPILGANSKTVVAWIYPTQYTNESGIVVMGNSSRSSKGTSYQFIINSSGNIGINVGSNMAYTNLVAPLNHWSFVASEYENGNYTVYLGSKNQTLTLTQQDLQQGPLEIGYNFINNNHFVGSIADIQIYDVALSASQIQQLYEAGMPASATAIVATP